MTKRRPVCPPPLQTAIEQAVARGWHLVHIAAHVGSDVATVLAVRRHMETLNTQPDVIHPKATGPRTTWGDRPRQPCGTTAAYHRHRRHGQRPCGDCRRAYAQDRAANRARGVFRTVADSINDPADASGQ